MENCSNNCNGTKMHICFVIVSLIFETAQFCLVGSTAAADFLAVSFGFAFLPVVSFPPDLFVSGGQK